MEILLNASRKLLELGLDPNRVIDNRKNTALHLAAVMGSAQLCRLFLDAGADKKATNRSGSRPFDYIKRRDRVAGLPNTQGMRTVVGISQSMSMMEAPNETILLFQSAEVLRLLGDQRQPGRREAMSEDDLIDEYSVRKSFCNTWRSRKH
eukprot:TRINITY_DN6148_c0_g2_i1.p1 TRINITY_DN6148_c0_g2~~TRINITY_DN6148_c0_g2_i1.p1  ORF type:complete len:157 (+),score=9.20 TRINITY_DN6148_c0_g2_i1:23-472(+)